MTQTDLFIRPIPAITQATYKGQPGKALIKPVSKGAAKFHWHFIRSTPWPCGVSDMFGLSFTSADLAYADFMKNSEVT